MARADRFVYTSLAAMLVLVGSGYTVPCPCADPMLCDVISVNYTKEVFMFTTSNTNRSMYELFDWDKMTTLALAKYTDDSLTCYAHNRSTRVVLMVSYPAKELLNPSRRSAWVAMVTDTVVNHFMDGAHLDFEDFIRPAEEAKRTALTDMFTSLYHELKSRNLLYQVTIDFNYDPKVPYHAYNYSALTSVADFMFLRTYGERRWVEPPEPCFAWASDANNVTIQGVKNFLKLGIPRSKIILGFGWYGFDYKCEKLMGERCSLALWRGRCTCGGARSVEYSEIVEKLIPVSSGVRRDAASGAPFINYLAKSASGSQNQSWHQVWYNDPASLRTRYPLAQLYGLRGVGAWVLRDLDYSDTPQARVSRAEMFAALPDWKHPA